MVNANTEIIEVLVEKQEYEEVKDWVKQKKTEFNSNEIQTMKRVYHNLSQGEDLPPEDICFLEWMESVLFN